MKVLSIILCVLFSSMASGQQGLIPLHSFHKDQLFANKLVKPFNNGSFLPANEHDYNLIAAINDSSKQYYTLTEILFKKYLFELRGEDYFVKISPAIDFSYGRDLEDTLSRKLFQNTRGVHVEVDLFKNFSFSTSLYENQSRNNYYESEYYSAVGELYPLTDTGYFTQNAVIPGGARTKAFKGDAFDYAYAVGYLVYRPFKWLCVTVGNNALFIGDGHRSLLHSDNSYSAPYYRINWRISDKFKFEYHRSRLLNLMRKPASGSVEAYYEPKGYSINYLTYMPTDKMSFSLFESGNWSRGDSLRSTYSHPLYYNPIPFLSGLILKGKDKVSSLLGLNINYQLFDNHRLYGQVAFNDYNIEKFAFQIGYRGYNYFGLKDFMLQVEYNDVANGTYEVENRRLNSVHYNLPLTHVKGNGFQEIILRANYEFKRVYAEISTIYYITKSYSPVALLPVYRDFSRSSNNIFYENIEIGYRFNRKMNLTLFGAWTYRTENDKDKAITNTVSVGIRTGFINHYKDF